MNTKTARAGISLDLAGVGVEDRDGLEALLAMQLADRSERPDAEFSAVADPFDQVLRHAVGERAAADQEVTRRA